MNMKSKELIALAEKVNNYWVEQIDGDLKSDWKSSCYMIGCISAYRMTGKKSYLDFALNWANKNEWKFFVNPFGPKPYYKNADNIACAQIYLPLLNVVSQENLDEFIYKELTETLQDGRYDYWSWCDLIHMGLPVYHMFAQRYHNPEFDEKGYQLFLNSKNEQRLYDAKEHMWYRDADYLPEKKLTPSGKKIFWGRGQGWALTGLVRALEIVRKESKYYEEYRKVYCEMVEALIPWQQEEGMWRCSIIDPKQYDVPETSSTVLITYALAKGIELGLLNREKYLPCVWKAFDAIRTICINEEGRIGYVQGVAGWPGPVYADGIEGYAVGSFVCLCEVLIKLI